MIERDYPQFPPGMQSSLGRIFAHRALGDLAASHAEAERIIALAHEHGQETYELWARRDDAETLGLMGRIDEANAILDNLPRILERQNTVALGIARMTVHLTAGRIENAVVVAEEALEALGWPRPFSPDTMTWLEAAAEAFIAAGRLDDARRAVAALDDRRLDGGGLATLIARSRLAIAEGHGSEAIADLRRVVVFLDDVGYVIDASRARALLVHALVAAGEADAAVAEADIAVTALDEHGAAGVAAATRAELAVSGIEVAPAPPVGGAPAWAATSQSGSAAIASAAPESAPRPRRARPRSAW